MKIATIDTMLSFYLAFLYTDRPYYSEFSDRILCMSKFLFEVQQKNRLQQKGLLRRFSITCYGHQESIEEMRAHRATKFKELKDKRGTKEFDEWFLNYKPEDALARNETKKTSETKKTTKSDTISKSIKKTKAKPKPKSVKNPKKKKMAFNFWGKKTQKNKKRVY